MQPQVEQTQKMQQSKIKRLQRKTQKSMKQQKDSKHRMYVLQQWLKTQITYKQDIQASINILKRRISQQQLIGSSQINKLFPQFQPMLSLSKNMIEIISKYKQVPINLVMIGKQLNKLVSYYKIYLQYFKHKTQMKNLYQQMEKNHSKKLKDIEIELQSHFQRHYQQKTIQQGKDKSQTRNPKANITIHDCLQRPLYRLFKYHLLIDSYLKKLPQTNPDYIQLKKTKQLFVQIGEKCNNSFTEQQKQDLKNKLQKLYGKSLPQTSQYKATMTAQTLYFPCKLYIFSDLFLISKAQKLIGFRQQKPYLNQGLDQFSFIIYKKDLKYFKNILLLCGIHQCIHFFLPDKGTRLQIHQKISVMIQQQKTKAFQKRQKKQIKPINKILFMADQNSKFQKNWLTGLKIQVLDVDMRALGVFNNDTVYIVSFSIPQYLDDEATFLKTTSRQDWFNKNNKFDKPQRQSQRQSMTKQQIVMKSKIGPVQYKKFQADSQFMKNNSYSSISQHIQIHLNDLIALHKQFKQNYDEVPFPQIDPFTKDFNFYSQSKKKTKSFEVRTFLIEQFFNFVFRNPIVNEKPQLWFIRKLKIDQTLFDYMVQRSSYLRNQKRDVNSQTPGNKYDQNHCENCKLSSIKNIEQFELIRKEKIKLNKIRRQNYCFNFYNLLRNYLLSLPFLQFDNMERMMIYAHYLEGRLDYCFLYKKNLAKKCKSINILVPKIVKPLNRQSSPKNSIYNQCEIHVDHQTTVGMIINSIAKDIEVYNMLDYRLVVEFNSQQRILDQDEFIYEVIDKCEIKYEVQTYEENDSMFTGPRNSIRQQSFSKTASSWFSMIRNVLPIINKNQSLIYLRKMVYFPMMFQLSSIRQNYIKSKIVIAQIFQKISRTSAIASDQVYGQICGIYYCIINYKELQNFSASQQILKICNDIIPQQKIDLLKNYQFCSKMTTTIINNKKYLAKMKQQQFISFLHQRVLRLGYLSFRTNTYLIPVTAKKIPNQLFTSNQLIFIGQCYLGVNHNQIIVARDKKDPTQFIKMPLQAVQIVHSVYSVFLTYKRQNKSKQQNSEVEVVSREEFQLRFDSKMLFGFVQLCQKYQLIKSKFGGFLREFSIDSEIKTI